MRDKKMNVQLNVAKCRKDTAHFHTYFSFPYHSNTKTRVQASIDCGKAENTHHSLWQQLV